MDGQAGVHHFSRHGYNADYGNNQAAGSPVSQSYSFLFDSRSTSLEATDDSTDSKINDRYNLPINEDASALGNMLVAMLNRFARHCSDADERLAEMRSQNLAQRAEIQELTERVKKLEALSRPAPRLATPPTRDRGFPAPPSSPHFRPPHQSEASAEVAIIENGRMVRMRAGERPRELWTACKTTPIPNGRSELERAGLERPYVHAKALPTPRPRRPPSPKPPPIRNARDLPIDAPPIPTRSVTSPEVPRLAIC